MPEAALPDPGLPGDGLPATALPAPGPQAQLDHLAAQVAQLRAILDAQSELVSQARPGGELVYVNAAYAAHFGHAPQDMLGRNLLDYVDPPDRPGVCQRMEQVLQTGESLNSKNRAVRQDGSERWVSWTNTRQVDASGQVLLHSTGRDITAQLQAERALVVHRRFLARTKRLAGLGGWEMDLATRTLTWTDETRRLHDLPPDFQPTVERALQFYEPPARETLRQAVQAALTQGIPWDLELPLVTAQGRHLWVRSIGEVEREQGRAVKLAGAVQDITARHQLQLQLADSERFLRLLTDSLPVRMAYLDAERRYRFVNQEWLRRHGLEREHVLGRTRSELLPREDDARFAARAGAALAGQAQQFEFEELVNGQLHEFENRLVPDRTDSGEVRGFFVTGIDITERARSERAVRSVADAIPATVAVMDNKGRYRFVNKAFASKVGKPLAEILGQGARAILGDAEMDRRMPWIQRALAGEQVSFELQDGERDGLSHTHVEYLPLRVASGEVDGFVVVTQDITAQKREQARLREMSQTDPLTGLLNRAGFEQRFDNMAEDAGGESLAVLYIDLDHFKPVNDTHGHGAGDELLRLLARRLTRLVRPTDAVARLGGDEFAVLLPGLGQAEHAERVAQAIVDALGQPFRLSGGKDVQIGASVGGAIGRSARQDWPRLLAAADRMLYRAKHAGRGRSVIDAAGAPKSPG